MPYPLRVYLDQLHLGTPANDQLEVLASYAQRGHLTAPVSVTHLLETWKDKPSRRDLVRGRLLSLAQGEVVAGELAVMLLESEAVRKGFSHDWVRQRVASGNVWDWVVTPISPLWLRIARRVAPISLSRLFDHLKMIPDDRRFNGIARDIFEKGADQANATHSRLPGRLETLKSLGLADLAFGRTEAELGLTFRALDARCMLQAEIVKARSAGVEPNDLPDLAFLCVVLPYFDAVCVDRKMLARIEEARKATRVPWARAFRRLIDMNAWLREQPGLTT